MQTMSQTVALLAATLTLWAAAAQAETVAVQVDPAQPWIGFVNVFTLPVHPGDDRGAYLGGLFLEFNTAALPAGFSGAVAMLGPNTYLGGAPPGDPFWWQPDGAGGYRPNKVLESNFYVETSYTGAPLAGKTVSFSGISLTQTLAAPYAVYAFVRDLWPDNSSLRASAAVPLLGGQAFEVSLDTLPGNVVQYGFALVGPNADPNTLGLGSVTVSAVPEPATMATMLLGALAVLGVSRRRKA